jgi:hypothetical protein
MDTNIQQDHPVSCTEYKSFWISWANNIIKVGKGNVVGMETFLTWNDQNPHPVNYVAFATGWGSTNINILTEICGFLLDSHCISDK